MSQEPRKVIRHLDGPALAGAQARAAAVLPNALILTDPRLDDNPIVYCNESFLRLTGYAAEQVLGRNCRFLQGAETAPEDVTRLRDAIRRQRPLQVTIRNYRKDGAPFWNELTVAPVRDAAGAVTHFVGVQTDVTERRDTELRRQAELREKAHLVDFAHDALIVRDMAGRITFFNPSAERLFGFPTGEADGRVLTEFLRAEYPLAEADIARALERTGVWDGEVVYVRRDGARVHVESRQALVRGDDGAAVCVLEVDHNVTDRRETERLIREARDFAEAVVATVREPLLVLDAGLRVVSANPAFYAAFGSRPEETEGQAVYELGGGEWDIPALRELLEAVLPQSRAFDGFRAEHVFPAVGRKVMLLNARRLEREGRDALILLAMEDATEREDSESALRESEARHRRLLDTANEGVLTVDAEDRIAYANPSLAAMLGYGPDALRGRPLYDLLFPEDVGEARRRGERRRGAQEQYELRLRRADGAEAWALANVSVLEEGGRYGGTFSLLTDISERRAAEERLAAAYRREALLNEIGQAVRQSLPAEAVERTGLAGLAQALGADRCLSILIDRERDLVRLTGEWHRPGLPPLAGDYPLSSFGVELTEVFPAGGTLAVSDTQAHPWSAQAAAAMARMGIRALLDVPLTEAGEVVGVLGVYMADAPRRWTEAEVSLAEAVASQLRAAAAAARARARERNISAQLQQALQPALPGVVPGLALTKYYEAALGEAEVGGDFYDVFAVEKGCTALVVGDLSGKGLAAAAQVSVVRNMLRAFLYSRPTVADAVTELNRVLAENNLLAGFSTLFVGTHDSATGLLNYVNCGQEPALVRRKATGAVEYLAPTGPILGAIEGAHYAGASAALEAGDALVVFTDGLTEVGRGAEMLGIGGVEDIVAQPLPSAGTADAARTAETLKRRLVAGADAHAGGVRDDMCLLVAVAE